jgi:hypothetical protein
MPQENLVVALHFFLLWGTVIIGLAAGLLLPVSKLIAIPLGVLLWILGLLYNLHLVQRRRVRNPHARVSSSRGNGRIAARSLMNFGIAFGFRSWLTIIAAFILIPLYMWAVARRREYVDFAREPDTGDVLPDRLRRQPGRRFRV